MAERAGEVTCILTVGDPALARDLVNQRLKRELANKVTSELALSMIRVEDIDVHVSQDAAAGWSQVIKWRQGVDLADLKLDHLDKSVWTEPRHALLWHLARHDPDPARAVEIVEPVRRLLRALDESDKPLALDGAGGSARSDSPVYVQIVEQLTVEAGERAFFALDLSRLLIRSGRHSEAAELKRRFIEKPRKTATKTEGPHHASGSTTETGSNSAQNESTSRESRSRDRPARS
ncbi:hypothetical protein [Frankia sp. R82]|uniref:hypothetical protein n=1 Tax=Frankia sp. R82 TaxID=2950553 RepID=UPI002043BD6C|nr:hypothetical protein [Frankia sp. R82]